MDRADKLQAIAKGIERVEALETLKRCVHHDVIAAGLKSVAIYLDEGLRK